MIRIPAGTWSVGSTREERSRLAQRYGFHPSLLADELEPKRASLPDFFIDEYPVTNAEYAAFLQETGHPEPYDWTLRATADRADHPVAGVGGEDAKLYAEWAGKRLPTPEEWEAAFHGVGELPDRKVAADDWMPQTHPRSSNPGPVSAHGLRGFGQLSEWTSRTKPHGPFTFRLLKGASWLCDEGWSLRVASACWAFGPWRAWWTGLRCASDKDVGPAPTADLPETPQQRAWPARDDSAAGLYLVSRGGQSVAVAVPGCDDYITALCPEGWEAEDAGGNRIEPPKLVRPAPTGTAAEAAYRLRTQGIEMEARFQAGADFFDMDYEFTSSHKTDCTVRASTCMNPGLNFCFYDLEGSRSYVWMGRGDWLPLRALPRLGDCPRWISYVSLPQPREYPAAILVAVVARDGRRVFGYGRPGLTQPPSLANNMCYSCLHLDPTVAVPAGGKSAARARIYCMPGGLDDLRRRFAGDFGLRSGK